MEVAFIIPDDEFHLWPTEATFPAMPETPQIGDAVVAGGTCWKVLQRLFAVHPPQRLTLHLVHAPELEPLMAGGKRVATQLH